MAINFDKIRSNLGISGTSTVSTISEPTAKKSIDFDKIKNNLGVNKKTPSLTDLPSVVKGYTAPNLVVNKASTPTTKTTPGGAFIETFQGVNKVTMPDRLSGGQFLSAVGKPNELITADRAYGTLKTKTGFERDHIYPVALGGTSQDPNLQYLRDNQSLIDRILKKPVEAKNRQEGKMLVELSAIKDYQNGIISLPEARARVLNWNNLPEPFYKTVAKELKDTIFNTVKTSQATPGVLSLSPKLVKDTVKFLGKSTLEFFDQVFRTTEAASTVASTPLAWGLDKVQIYNIDPKVKFTDLGNQNMQTAKQLLFNERQWGQTLMETSVDFLKKRDAERGGKPPATVKEAIPELGAVAALGFFQLMGDPFLEGTAIARLSKGIEEALLWKKVKTITKVYPGVKFTKPRTVEFPAYKVDGETVLKVKLEPYKSQITIKGFAKRGWVPDNFVSAGGFDEAVNSLQNFVKGKTGLITNAVVKGNDLVLSPTLTTQVLADQRGVIGSAKAINSLDFNKKDITNNQAILDLSSTNKTLKNPEDGGIYFHGTSNENYDSLIKNGFNAELNRKGFAEQPEAFHVGDIVEGQMYGDRVVAVKAKDNVTIKTLNSSDLTAEQNSVLKTGKDRINFAKENGYDAINDGDELVIVNPKKFDVFDPSEIKLDNLQEANKTTVKPIAPLLHGTRADFTKFSGEYVNLTRNRRAAEIFAGGSFGSGKKRILKVEAPTGKTKHLGKEYIAKRFSELGDLEDLLQEETRKARKEGFEFIKFADNLDSVGDFPVVVALNPDKLKIIKTTLFQRKQVSITNIPRRLQTELIKDVLPPGFTYEFTNTIFTETGARAMGVIADNHIQISKLADLTTPIHESWHAFVQDILTASQRRELFDYVINRYNLESKNLPKKYNSMDLWAEEVSAELVPKIYYKRMKSKSSFKRTIKDRLLYYVDKLVNMVKQLVGKRDVIKDFFNTFYLKKYPKTPTVKRAYKRFQVYDEDYAAIVNAEIAKEQAPLDIIAHIQEHGYMSVTRDIMDKTGKLVISEEVRELHKTAPYLFKKSDKAMGIDEMLEALRGDGFDVYGEYDLAEAIRKAQTTRKKYNIKSSDLKPSTKNSIKQFRKEVEILPKNTRDKILDVELPPASNIARVFGLLGNKATSVSLFNEIYDKWVKDGARVIIEPYAGAFTIGQNSLRNAVLSGLQEYHANIYDKDKYFLIKGIQDGKLGDIKRYIDNTIKLLNKEVLTAAKALDDELYNIFSKFLSNKDNYIGSKDFALYMRKNKWQARIKNYADDYERVRKILQTAYDQVNSLPVTDLASAVQRAFIEKTGHFGQASQNLITRAGGFKVSLENSIYGKYGMVSGIEQIADTFKFASDNGTKVVLYGPERDGISIVNDLKNKFKPEEIGIYSDPPYVKSAGVYAEKSKELDKFTSGEKFVKSHQAIFDLEKQGARVAFTNDIDDGYINQVLGSLTKENGKLYAYREGNTPTTLIMSDESFYVADEFFAMGEQGYTRLDKWADLEYLSKAIRRGGYTKKTIARLRSHGVRDDVINTLMIDDNYLKDLVKVKVEANGEVSTVISKRALDYIRRTSKVKNVNKEFIKTTILRRNTERLSNTIQLFETGYRFFRRMGVGYKNLIFDPIRAGERLAVQHNRRIHDKLQPLWYLNKKEAEVLFAYTAKKQGIEIKSPDYKDLPTKIKNAYKAIRAVVKDTYPAIKRTAWKNGHKLGFIKNYTPLYTADDIGFIYHGSLVDFVGKDPRFKSLKERTFNTDPSIYKTDYRKVMIAWAQGATRYIHVGSRSLPVKYLLDSEELTEIAGNDARNKMMEFYRESVSPTPPKQIAEVFIFFRSLASLKILGLKYSVVVKQFLNIFDARVITKTRFLIKSGSKVLGQSPVARNARLTGSILERHLGYEIIDLSNAFIQFFAKPAKYTDRLTARIVHIGIMEQQLMRFNKTGQRMTPKIYKKMVRVADNMVDATMGTVSAMDKPAAYRTETGKALLMFTSPLNAKLQFHLTDIYTDPEILKLTGGKKKLNMFIRSLVTLLLAGFAEQVINKLYFDDPKDMATDTIKQVIGNIPMVGSIMYVLESSQEWQPMPVIANLSAMFKALSTGNYIDTSWELAGILGLSDQVKNLYEGSIIIKEGGVFDKEGKLLFEVTDPLEKTRTLIKGKWGSRAAQESFRESPETQAVNKIFKKLKKAKEDGDKEAIKNIMASLTEEQAGEIIKMIKADIKSTKPTEQDVMKIYIKAEKLKSQGKTDEAKKLISGLSEDEADIFISIIKKLNTK